MMADFQILDVPTKIKEPAFSVILACNTLTQIQQGPYFDHMRFAYRLGLDFPHIQFIQFFAKRISIDRFRNWVTRVAIQRGARYILFIDDDMQIPYDTFHKLYYGSDQYDILSAFTYIRG